MFYPMESIRKTQVMGSILIEMQKTEVDTVTLTL